MGNGCVSYQSRPPVLSLTVELYSDARLFSSWPAGNGRGQVIKRINSDEPFWECDPNLPVSKWYRIVLSSVGCMKYTWYIQLCNSYGAEELCLILQKKVLSNYLKSL